MLIQRLHNNTKYTYLHEHKVKKINVFYVYTYSASGMSKQKGQLPRASWFWGSTPSIEFILI